MSFNGLDPWEDDFPKVDFQTPLGLVDLHNNANLEKIYFSVARAELVFEFRYSHDWRKISSSGHLIDLKFGNVTNLRVVQAEDYDSRSASTFEGIQLESKKSRFIVDAGDVRYDFNAEAVALRMRSQGSDPLAEGAPN